MVAGPFVAIQTSLVPKSSGENARAAYAIQDSVNCHFTLRVHVATTVYKSKEARNFTPLR